MNPAIQYELMQAKQHDIARSAARRHVVAEARAARQPRRDRTATATAPRRRALHLVWRLLPS
jgi:hypothetical protein